MKVLVFVSGVLAVVSGQWAGHAPVGYQNQIPQHVPVIKDGVPVETPEVQHAKAAHFAAITEARSHPSYQPFDESQQYIQQEQYNQQGQYNQQPQGGRYTAPVQGGYSGFSQGFSGFNQGGYSAQPVQSYNFQPAQYSAPAQHVAPVHGQRSVIPAFETTHAVPQVGHDGKPLDTPEVEAAKAQHFALVNEALVRNAPKPGYQNQPAPHYRQRRGIYAAYPQHIPVIGHNGVPVEPIEVQKARAEHLAAYSGVSHNTGHLGYSVQQHHAPVYGHHDSYTHFIPSYGHDGRPLDTPEVEHAKAAHFAAYHEAASRNSLLAHGVPADTPAVQHAKALHYAAHAAASSHAHHY